MTPPSSRRYHMISWVASRYDIHPQTLRLYEREGLLQPTRSEGNTRLYDNEACERLEFILTLTRDMGVNLAGVEVILGMKQQIDALTSQVLQLQELLERETARRTMIGRANALAPRPAGGLVPSEEE